MPDEDLILLSKARLGHAKECLFEADSLCENGMYKGAANRAYYAAFHALRAVLILDGYDSKKHSGIISKFREIYIKTEIFTQTISDNISSLFRTRTSSDYDDFFLVSNDEAAEQIKKAKETVTAIEAYLSEIYSQH